MILAGDIGGTNARLAIYRPDDNHDNHFVTVHEMVFASKEFRGLDEIVLKFVAETGVHPEVASFGIAGPVRNGRVETSNLPWVIESSRLAAELHVDAVHLINDLEAQAWGIQCLGPADTVALTPIPPSRQTAVGNQAVVAAGTGLGEAGLLWDEDRKQHQIFACEGGHCDFAPRNELEIDLLRYLQGELKGRVSFERVVSGIGLKNIYSFLRDEKGMEEPSWLKDRMHQEDPNAVIGEVGEDGSNELCAKTLDMFASAYGAEAGNLALKVLSVGGLYLGGGIAPKILKTMKNGTFMQAFTDKGRLSDLLVHMPVRIILESRAALMGAAAYAEARAAQISGQSVRAASVQFS